MRYEQFERAFDAEGYDQMEVYGTRKNRRTFGMSDNRLKTAEENEDIMVGVRVLVDNRVGFSSSSNPQNILETARRAVKLAEVSQSKMMSLPVKDGFEPVEGIYDDNLVGKSTENIIGELKNSVEFPEGIDVSDAKIEVSESEVFLVNSNGVRGDYRKSSKSGYVSLTDGDISRFSFHSDTRNFPFERVASRAKRLLEDSRERAGVSSGRYDVVLTPFALRQILSGLFYPAISAETVKNGESFLEGRIGDRVFSEDISIKDYGRLPRGNGSRSFDREGVRSQETKIVDKGVLNSFLYDVKHAERDGTASTGNASGGPGSTPSIAPSNIVLEGSEGEKSGDLIINSVSGVHTADRTTGEYSLNITCGFVDEDGIKGLKSGVLVGDVVSLLDSFSHFYGDVEKVGELISRKAVFEDQKIVV